MPVSFFKKAFFLFFSHNEKILSLGMPQKKNLRISEDYLIPISGYQSVQSVQRFGK